jgi:hypothetical protein
MGRNGVFAPGRRISLAEIEERDGSSYTAGLAERLVGDHQAGHFASWNYAMVEGPLPLEGCSLIMLKDRQAVWQGDAGCAWTVADYRSTLYNHALRPNAPLSCLAIDGESAFMGASSGHVRGVNLLMMDGSVKLLVPSIDPTVWREFASISTGDRSSTPADRALP